MSPIISYLVLIVVHALERTSNSAVTLLQGEEETGCSSEHLEVIHVVDLEPFSVSSWSSSSVISEIELKISDESFQQGERTSYLLEHVDSR